MEKTIEEYRTQLRDDLIVVYGNEPRTIKMLNRLIDNCEKRIAQRIKNSTCLLVYTRYYDVIFQMVKCDFNEIGVEGERSRNANGISFTKEISRASDEVLSKIPLVI